MQLHKRVYVVLKGLAFQALHASCWVHGCGAMKSSTKGTAHHMCTEEKHCHSPCTDVLFRCILDYAT